MALFPQRPKGYKACMKQFAQQPVLAVTKIALGVAIVAAATGVAFASWMDKGAGIFMAMVESGLSWCF